MKLLSFDSCFIPAEKNKIDTTAKLIATLSGGPAVSLILALDQRKSSTTLIFC